MKNSFEIRNSAVAIFLHRRNGDVLECQIDLLDLPIAQSYEGTWYAAWEKKTKSFYAKANVKGKSPFLHRWILQPDIDQIVDHRNHNTLDNRRSNLRIGSNSENMQNRKGLQSNNKSGYRGVTWHKRDKKWEASLTVNRKRIHLGLYDDPEVAADVVSKERIRRMPFTNEREIV